MYHCRLEGNAMTKKIIVGFGMLCLAFVFYSCPSGPNFYPRIVIDTFPYKDWPLPTDTTLRLYDSGGNLVAFDDDNLDVPFDYQPSARIDYAGGLNPGIYYIRVNSDASNPGEYVVRVLDLEIGEDPNTSYVFPGTPSDDSSFEPDDSSTGNIPDSPIDIGLGNVNQRNRMLNLGTDVDWLRLVLP
jgi:hypothetical protein